MADLRSNVPEFGRDRPDDSSSSRESSPQPKRQKRSFTPTSDDDSLVVPPVVDDDTPPPENAPLIRQAVAFSWDKGTAPLNTYEASVPPTPASHFLPGQAVPAVTKPSSPIISASTKRGSKSKKKTSRFRKTRHFNDAFSAQTGRMRLTNYVNEVQESSAPPIYYGMGPYSSMYRATSDTTSNSTSQPVAESASPVPVSIPHNQGSAVPSTILPMAQATSSPTNSTSNKKSKVTEALSKPVHERQPSEPKTSFHELSTSNAPSSQGQGPYYRRDYEKDIRLSEHSQATSRSPRSTRGRSGSNGHDVHVRKQSPSRTLLSPHSHDNHTKSFRNGVRPDSQGNSKAAPKARPPPPPRVLRMVTLLIVDGRSGHDDHQLAEVKVPLRPAEIPEDGYWADAEEVCDKLQSSPSRIDGPAKLYTLRGKYRQFFLRVTSDNVDHCFSANLRISPERTLDVVVELPPQEGTLPAPPKIPPELRYPDDASPSPTVTPQRLPSTDPSRSGILDQINSRSSSPVLKRGCSPMSSSDDYDGHSPGSHPMASSKYGSPTQPSFLQRKSSVAPPKMLKLGGQDPTLVGSPLDQNSRLHTPRLQSPGHGASEEQIFEALLQYVKSVIEPEPGWKRFFVLKGLPPRVSVVLEQYRFVQNKIDDLRGKAPFQCHDHQVDRTHILKALFLDEKWGAECTETLRLLELYGPNGKVYESPQVVEMINDTSAPVGKPAKRLLKMLRELDQDWLRKDS